MLAFQPPGKPGPQTLKVGKLGSEAHVDPASQQNSSGTDLRRRRRTSPIVAFQVSKLANHVSDRQECNVLTAATPGRGKVRRKRESSEALCVEKAGKE